MDDDQNDDNDFFCVCANDDDAMCSLFWHPTQHAIAHNF